MVDSYIFDTSKGETPKSVAERRRLSDALAARIFGTAPKNVGEGINAIGQALIARTMRGEADDAEKAGLASGNDAFSKITALLGGGAPGTSTAATVAAPDAGLVSTAPTPTPMAPSVSSKIYGNDEPSPLDPPSGQDRDMAIRTVFGEDPGTSAAGVANVIRNRAINGGFGGDTIPGVVLAKNQFEPWNNAAARARMQALDPNSPTYKRLGDVVDQAYSGTDDPTNGATMFYSPSAQAALGRNVPAWAQGPSQDIGEHRFYGGATPQAVQAAQAAQATPAAAPADDGETTIPANATAAVGSLPPQFGGPDRQLAPPQPLGPNTPAVSLAPQTPPATSIPNAPQPPQMAQASPQAASPVPPAPIPTPAAPAPAAPAAPSMAPSRGGPSVQQLMQAASNPWLTDGQRAAVTMMLKQKMTTEQQASDPMRQLQMDKLRTDIAKANGDTSKPVVIGANSEVWDPKTKTVIHKNEISLNSTLDPQTVSDMADQYLAGDRTVMQNLGRGQQGAENVVKLRAEISRRAREAGVDPKGIVDNFNEQAGALAGHRAVGTRAANIALAANEANNMIPIALDASLKVPRTQWVPINQAMQMVQRGSSSPELASFVAATNSLVNSYVRAVSPTGVPTDSMREHAYTMLNSAQGPEAYASVIKTMQMEMHAALAAPSAVRKELRRGGQDEPPPSTPEAAPSATPVQPAIQEGATATNSKTGERLIYRNGKWAPLS